MKKESAKKTNKAVEAKRTTQKNTVSKLATRSVAKGSSGSKSEPKIT